MKKSALSLLLALAACAPGGSAPKPVVSEQDKTLHALGVGMEKSIEVFKLSPEEFDRVVDGMRAGRAGKPEVKFEAYQQKISQFAQERMMANTGPRKEADAKAAEKLASDPKAKTLPSGLVYIPTAEGTGASPKATDKVKVHYAGKLTDDTEFDSSYKRGQPVSFPLAGVIPCWTEGLQLMKVGGKGRLVCPSTIAYGDNGRPPVIPGGATLIFDIELLGIEK